MWRRGGLSWWQLTVQVWRAFWDGQLAGRCAELGDSVPYLPLADALRGAAQSTGVRDALSSVGLPQLAMRLEEEAHWNRMLSLGEQQRLGLARALLHAPQYLFLDEATASLDEASEATLYRLLEERLPQTTIVSIGHRSTLEVFHQRKVVLARDGDRFTLRKAGEEQQEASPS